MMKTSVVGLARHTPRTLHRNGSRAKIDREFPHSADPTLVHAKIEAKIVDALSNPPPGIRLIDQEPTTVVSALPAVPFPAVLIHPLT